MEQRRRGLDHIDEGGDNAFLWALIAQSGQPLRRDLVLMVSFRLAICIPGKV